MSDSRIHSSKIYFLGAVILGIVSILFSLFRYDLLYFTSTLIFLILIYGIYTGKQDHRSIRDLTLITSIPLLLGAGGISQRFSRYLFETELAFAVILPIFGYMIIFNLWYHTNFTSDLTFSVWFIILFSMAGASIWGKVRFLSDEFFRTDIILGNDELMVELLLMTIVSVLVAYFFRIYMLRRKQARSDGLLNKIKLHRKGPRRRFLNVLRSGVKERRWALYSSRALQLGIGGLTIYGLFHYRIIEVVTGVFSLILALFPYFYTRHADRDFSYLLELWISLALFLHVLGGAGGLYEIFPWFGWDKVTHLVSGTIVAVLVLFFLIYIDRVSNSIHIPFNILLLFVLIFMFSIGVIWELYEFFGDTMFGTDMQSSLHDTVYDMIFNIFGTLITIAIAKIFWEPKY